MAHMHGEAGTKARGRRGPAKNAAMAACIDACTACHRACTETVRAFLDKDSGHMASEHVTVLLDCAQLCATSADFMLRGSHAHAVTCRACAEVCRACATSCRGVGGAQLEACAAACDACADSCEAMVSTHH